MWGFNTLPWLFILSLPPSLPPPSLSVSLSLSLQVAFNITAVYYACQPIKPLAVNGAMCYKGYWDSPARKHWNTLAHTNM